MILIPTEATFRSGPPIPRSSLETFSRRVPARAAALWGEHGLGQTAGGYLRIVDPDYFDWAPWPEARELVGVPEADECLGSAPLPALGGTRSAGSLQTVGMREHILLIASLAGPLD